MKRTLSAVAVLTTLALVAWACTSAQPPASGAPEAPTAPPREPLPPTERAQAELLARRMRCTACHDDDSERVWPELAPVPLAVGARRTPESIRRWLNDPQAVKPGAAMPFLFGSLAPAVRAETIEDLTHFLASMGGPLAPPDVEVDVLELERGRQLFHSVGCVACHTPQESADDLQGALWSFPREEALVAQKGSDLGHPAFDTSVDALADFLLDPSRARPSGRMPALRLAGDEARAIALYLLRERIRPEDLVESPGLAWTRSDGTFARAEPGFGGAPVAAGGVAADLAGLPERSERPCGFTLRGLLDAPRTGFYEFTLFSDGAASLLLDGRPIAGREAAFSPRETRAQVWLEKGKHALVAAVCSERAGQTFALSWTAPHGEEELVPALALKHWTARMTSSFAPFALDPARVERGFATFRDFGCASCHMIGRGNPGAVHATLLRDLPGRLDRGCLADEPVGVPRFALDAIKREQLRRLLSDYGALQQPFGHDEAIASTMNRLDCFACHRRGERGGPSEERAPYFRALVKEDVGDEIRFPPLLDGVGSKLKRAAIERVLLEGATERPYIATRMPQFGDKHVSLIAAHFAAVDARPDDLAAPPFDEQQAELGRQLASFGALGCIQCHRFAGVESVGVPAVDLTHVEARVQPGWFRRLLADPKSVGMNTRMPELWQKPEGEPHRIASPVRDVLGGDPHRQIEALWAYVSLGVAMPSPDGLAGPRLQ